MDLDDVLPEFDQVTHQSKWIAAPPPAVWEELHQVRLTGLPVTLVLGAMRFLPLLLAGKGRDQLRDRPFLDAEALRAWSEPGWVKAGLEFRLTPSLDGTQLSSETRVLATDPATRRRFARYWLAIGPGGSAVRWEVLTAVALRAEARSR